LSRPARTRYGTFTLGGAELGDGIVHLRSDLPEVVAIGHDALVEFMKQIPPLGGPHAEMNMTTKRLHVVTPEAEFTYEHIQPERDSEGWYFLFRLVWTSSTYQEFLAMR
jgi:hypothetical protein